MKDEKLDLTVQDPALAAFGYGRRNWFVDWCLLFQDRFSTANYSPGREMALDTVWITLASVLSAFNISKALDGGGRPITPSGRYISSIVRCVAYRISATKFSSLLAVMWSRFNAQ